ncbi:MAG: hypothetical protein AB1505_35710, partial [Candidatus Latescibacterota bacterium]
MTTDSAVDRRHTQTPLIPIDDAPPPSARQTPARLGLLLPVVLAALLLAAHFFRAGQPGLVLFCL